MQPITKFCLGIVAIGAPIAMFGMYIDMHRTVAAESSWLAVLLLWLTGLAIYISPILVATYRGCKATPGIVVVTLFLGWTFIGWVAALAWAACGERQLKPLPATVS